MQYILVIRVGTVFLPRVGCVVLMSNGVSLCSGQLGDRPPILSYAHPLSGGGGETDMFRAGEEMPVSQFTGSVAAG
jgi:hypothetical protein